MTAIPGLFRPNPAADDYHQFRRLFVKTTGAPTGSAYPWSLQYQNAAGTWSNDPSGIVGTATDNPLYMSDGSTSVASGTVCEAVQYTGGYLIGWPIRANPFTLGYTQTTYGPGTYSWTPPTNLWWVEIELVGAGGGGAGAGASGGTGGGGGSGAYIRFNHVGAGAASLTVGSAGGAGGAGVAGSNGGDTVYSATGQLYTAGGGQGGNTVGGATLPVCFPDGSVPSCSTPGITDIALWYALGGDGGLATVVGTAVEIALNGQSAPVSQTQEFRLHGGVAYLTSDNLGPGANGWLGTSGSLTGGVAPSAYGYGGNGGAAGGDGAIIIRQWTYS